MNGVAGLSFIGKYEYSVQWIRRFDLFNYSRVDGKSSPLMPSRKRNFDFIHCAPRGLKLFNPLRACHEEGPMHLYLFGKALPSLFALRS